MVERVVRLERRVDVGFGFSVIGGGDTHIPPMICALVRDSPALYSRQVHVGDVLLKVNGVDVSNLTTKQVVNLIRNCNEIIVLNLKEDRIAKLKAIPFLAEDSLIEPPQLSSGTSSTSLRSHPSPTHMDSHNFQRVSDSPNTYQYETKGRFMSRNKTHTTSSVSSLGNANCVTARLYDSPVSERPCIINSHTDYEKVTKPNLVDPRYAVNSPNNFQYTSSLSQSSHSSVSPHSVASYHSLPEYRKDMNDVDYAQMCDSQQAKRTNANHHSLERQHIKNTSYASRKHMAPSSSSGFNDTSINYPEMERSGMLKESFDNYSDPNLFEDVNHKHQEHRSLTLTPYAHSNEIISSTSIMYDNINNSLVQEKIAGHHDQQLLPTKQPTVEPLNISKFAIESDDISPADVASRLFTLNGYKDSDVAPMLGKNTDFSRQTCQEYLRFFDFEGLGLDDALRTFLKKFSLTGETQERERILIQFSKRFKECNSSIEYSEDSLHTLVCSLMLLNTDLHGNSISTKMKLNDFIHNLSGLNDGEDFPKEKLKTLYSSIKEKEIQFVNAPKVNLLMHSPKTRRKGSEPGNLFVDLKVESNAVVICKGLVYRKSVMDADGRRTPAMRRNWRPFYCVLRGLVLLHYKPDNINAHEPQSIGVHHCLAGFAKDYKKRAFIFKLITADWKVLYFQAKNQDEVRYWMDCLNVSAALLSAPPLPAPVSSSCRFQKPLMPVSLTRLNLADQIKSHSNYIKSIESDLRLHCEFSPESQLKDNQEWESKLDYLEFELKRFKAYITVLTAPRLEKLRLRLTKGDTGEASLDAMPKSPSMHELVKPLSPRTQGRVDEKRRGNYMLSVSGP